MGVNPLPLSLRELVWMAESGRISRWEPFASLLCLLANVHRDTKKKPTPFTPADFLPNSKTKKSQRIELDEKETVEVLRMLFCRK